MSPAPWIASHLDNDVEQPAPPSCPALGGHLGREINLLHNNIAGCVVLRVVVLRSGGGC